MTTQQIVEQAKKEFCKANNIECTIEERMSRYNSLNRFELQSLMERAVKIALNTKTI